MAEKLLRFKDLYVAEYRPGEDELTNYRAMKRKKHMYEKVTCPKCNGEGCDHCDGKGYHEDDPKEALNIRQRLARARQFRRYKSKIKLGRDRAKRRMAKPDVLKRRSQKAARKVILKKLTKGIDKSDMSFARRQELEKRLERPAVKKRIAMLAKRMYKDVRKKEVARKKG
tara:strand:+ start:1010 stop:1519 length:510 start_codon:yes stop_codon:yes gene_type:complete